MGKLIDLTGKTFGYWTVLGRGRTEPNRVGTRVFWRVRCICGTEKEVVGHLLKRKKWPSKSCGCKTSELISGAHTVHGHNARGRRTGEHHSWAMMVNRTCNPLADDWKYYGGRGITLDPRWRSFEVFLADMGPRPPKHTIERKDNNGNYEPSNCIWASRAEQTRNRKR